MPFQLAWMEQGRAPAIRSLEAPTGLGKTLATLVGWLWDRQQRPSTTPRRLVYQLPLRTLTEQIAVECRAVMGRLGLEVPVYVLRGGQIDNDYVEALAAEAVIVGTLDQVVSRQLMRGYCCSRWSWPRHFAALNTDVRVVVDETQLQGAAVRTAIRLQQLHQQLGGPAPRELVLCSATLDAAILLAGTPRHGLSDADYSHPVAERKVGRAKPLTLAGATDGAALVRAHHQEGTLTLVVMNQVARAQELALQLADAQDGGLPTLLLHSRFRRAERQAIEAQLREFRGVVVATQTVEAGIDLDARLLITELCPWASFVQRCGRVGRNNTLPWLPPDYLAGVLLNQWPFDGHVPIKGDRNRWEQLLLAARPEEAMEVALHRLRVADVVSWTWPAIAASDPQRLLRAVEVPVHPRTPGRAKAGE